MGDDVWICHVSAIAAKVLLTMSAIYKEPFNREVINQIEHVLGADRCGLEGSKRCDKAFSAYNILLAVIQAIESHRITKACNLVLGVKPDHVQYPSKGSSYSVNYPMTVENSKRKQHPHYFFYRAGARYTDLAQHHRIFAALRIVPLMGSL